MSNDKRKPIEERIAALLGKSSYVDLRDGLGGTCPLRIRDQDIAAALGWVSQRVGKLGPLVLETHYGSTLIHKPAIRQAWEERERKPGQTREQVVVTRFAGELATRQLASFKYTSTDYAELSYLIFSRRETLQLRVRDAASWLDGIRDTALVEMRRSLREKWGADKEAKKAAA